jgi:hypothetical protein
MQMLRLLLLHEWKKQDKSMRIATLALYMLELSNERDANVYT